MTKALTLLLALFLAVAEVRAQPAELQWPTTTDEATLASTMPELAKKVIAGFKDGDRDRYLNTIFRLQMVAGEWDKALASIFALRELRLQRDPAASSLFLQYEILLNAKRQQLGDNLPADLALKSAFEQYFGKLDNKTAHQAAGAFSYDLNASREALQQAMAPLKQKQTISIAEALDVLRKFHVYEAYRGLLPAADILIAADDDRRYVIDENVLIKTPAGATLSAVVIRPRNEDKPQPTALFFTIYANPVAGRNQARQSAANGYVGVVADARGKRLSPDEIRPYETEVNDVNAVIDWVSTYKYTP